MLLNKYAFKQMALDIQAKKWLFIGIWIAVFAAVMNAAFSSEITDGIDLLTFFGGGLLEKIILPAFSILLYIMVVNCLLTNHVFALGSRSKLVSVLIGRSVLTATVYIFAYTVFVFLASFFANGSISCSLSMLVKLVLLYWSFLVFIAAIFILATILIRYFIAAIIIVLFILPIDQSIDVYFNKSIINKRILWSAPEDLFFSEALMRISFFIGISLLLFVVIDSIIRQKNFY